MNFYKQQMLQNINLKKYTEQLISTKKHGAQQESKLV